MCGGTHTYTHARVRGRLSGDRLAVVVSSLLPPRRRRRRRRSDFAPPPRPPPTPSAYRRTGPHGACCHHDHFTFTIIFLSAGTRQAGQAYDIFRWDSVGEAFTYQDRYKKDTFTADGATHVFEDDVSFPSDGTTYYRVVPAAAAE